MKKYKNQIIHGDFRRVMPDILPNSYDLLITSPPYNMNLRISNGKYCSRQIVKEISTKYDGYDDNMTMDDYHDMLNEIFFHSIRVAKLSFINIQCVTGNKPALFSTLGAYSRHIKEVIVWDKINAQPAMQTGVLNSQFEFIFVLQENAMSRQFTDCKFNRGTLSNLWQIPKAKAVKGHGATFPEELVARIMENFSNAGDNIIDPMCGTGTTCAVAKKMGRNYTGIELLENYADKARERCDEILI